MNQTNGIVFKAKKSTRKEDIYVTIRLNDECKNGHQDFAITGDTYEAGKPKADRYFISGGCIHDTIAKHFPQFIPFIKLHLCDWQGIPMHPVANMFYHLRNGFNNTKPDAPTFKAEYCEYYRVTEQQFDRLRTARNQVQLDLLLHGNDIFKQWKEEADKAIAYLEELSGKKFVVDSKRSQYTPSTPEELLEEERRQATGYYTPEAEAERAKQKQWALLEKLEAERSKEVRKADIEFNTKKQVLLIGGEEALKNCIFYNHSNTLAFNWRGYDAISQELIDKIIAEGQWPEGVTIENKGK